MVCIEICLNSPLFCIIFPHAEIDVFPPTAVKNVEKRGMFVFPIHLFSSFFVVVSSWLVCQFSSLIWFWLNFLWFAYYRLIYSTFHMQTLIYFNFWTHFFFYFSLHWTISFQNCMSKNANNKIWEIKIKQTVWIDIPVESNSMESE